MTDETETGAAQDQAADAVDANATGTAQNDSGSLLAGHAAAPVLDFANGRPEAFPEDMWDTEKNAPNVQKMYDALNAERDRVKGLRQKISAGGHKPPETVDGYEVKFEGDLYEKIKSDDPLVGAARQAALKAGMSKEAFSAFINEIVPEFVKLTSADALAQGGEEQAVAARQAEMQKLGENGVQITRAVAAWANGMKAQGVFAEQELATLETMAKTADQVLLLNKMRTLMGGPAVPVDIINDGLPSDKEIGARLHKAYTSGDPAKIAEIEALLEKRRVAGRPDLLAL